MTTLFPRRSSDGSRIPGWQSPELRFVALCVAVLALATFLAGRTVYAAGYAAGYRDGQQASQREGEP